MMCLSKSIICHCGWMKMFPTTVQYYVNNCVTQSRWQPSDFFFCNANCTRPLHFLGHCKTCFFTAEKKNMNRKLIAQKAKKMYLKNILLQPEFVTTFVPMTAQCNVIKTKLNLIVNVSTSQVRNSISLKALLCFIISVNPIWPCTTSFDSQLALLAITMRVNVTTAGWC